MTHMPSNSAAVQRWGRLSEWATRMRAPYFRLLHTGPRKVRAAPCPLCCAQAKHINTRQLSVYCYEPDARDAQVEAVASWARAAACRASSRLVPCVGACHDLPHQGCWVQAPAALLWGTAVGPAHTHAGCVRQTQRAAHCCWLDAAAPCRACRRPPLTPRWPPCWQRTRVRMGQQQQLSTPYVSWLWR